MSRPPIPSSPVPPVDRLRALTGRERGLPILLKAVRSAYRAQRRRPQLEAAVVTWVERVVRLFPDEPAGRIALLHPHTVLRRLEQRRPLTPAERRRVREALRFLRVDVLAQSGAHA
jgi:hypothetical protein